MIRVIMVCAAGMSTSILVNNMKKMADPDDQIRAYPVSQLEDHIDECDVVLVGPQIRHQFSEIQALAKKYGKKVSLMDLIAYGHMDGATMIEQAKALQKNKV
jgi:PTS system cellobiose-specific IIB component